MQNEEYTADKLASIYIKMRSAIKEHEDEIAKIKKQQELVSEKLLDLCNAENLDSLRTPEGTVTRRVHSSYWTSDWDEFYEYVKKYDAYFLLEKRIHNGNMKQFLEENQEDIPIGLQANKKYIISVRKPTTKK
jgi:predicted secreted Zn-dependent protease